eukprot:gene25405-34538_t
MLAAFSPEAFSQGHCLSLREGAEAPTYEEVADALGQVTDDVYEEPSARQSQVLRAKQIKPIDLILSDLQVLTPGLEPGTFIRQRRLKAFAVQFALLA